MLHPPAANSGLSANSVVITGMGVQSSLGGMATACAAARAGVSRTRELEDFPVLAEDGTEVRVSGHIVRTATGFHGSARLLSLGWSALEDLLRTQPELRTLPHAHTGLLLCLPDPTSRRPRQPADETQAQASQSPPAPRPPALSPGGRELCSHLTRLAGLPIPEHHWGDACQGHAGPALMLHQALLALRTRQWSRCLLGALDSLVDEQALEWLHETGRLKAPDTPDGIVPGEAGVFIMLERFDEARRRGANILAVATEVAVTHEAQHFLTGHPSSALAQVAALSQILSPQHAPAPREVLLINDHNGETYRANEWGSLLIRLAAQFPSVRVNAAWFPAMCFGDTGAASMALGICMATRSFHRGYHRAPTALLLSSSDAGPRGALRLDHPEAT